MSHLTKSYHRAMLPFYIFVAVVVLFAGGRRIAGLVVVPEESQVQSDCEKICGKFQQCLQSFLQPAQYKQYSFIIGAGCRNGCARQSETMGACFENPAAECMQIAECIGSKLR